MSKSKFDTLYEGVQSLHKEPMARDEASTHVADALTKKFTDSDTDIGTVRTFALDIVDSMNATEWAKKKIAQTIESQPSLNKIVARLELSGL